MKFMPGYDHSSQYETEWKKQINESQDRKTLGMQIEHKCVNTKRSWISFFSEVKTEDLVQIHFL